MIPLLDYIFNYMCTILRCQKENKKYALILNINTVIYFFASCVGAFMFGIAGVIIGRYIAYLISIIQGFNFCNYREIITGQGKKDVYKRQGLKCGEDFYLGFSPERVDPGNLIYKTKNTPKVVGAIGTVSYTHL